MKSTTFRYPVPCLPPVCVGRHLSCASLHGRQRAFTLVELLVVIVLIVTLAGTAFMMLRRVSASADQAVSVSNLRQLGVTARNYANDHNDRIIPNRFQNYAGGGVPGFYENWRQMLVDSEYVSADENEQRNAKDLGHPGLVRKHGKTYGHATFAMNQRLGYRPNPNEFHGAGTYTQASAPDMTLFMTGGVFKTGYMMDTDYPEVVWPTGNTASGTFPEPDASGRVMLMFLDGRVELRSFTEIPNNENPGRNRMFWRGRNL